MPLYITMVLSIPVTSLRQDFPVRISNFRLQKNLLKTLFNIFKETLTTLTNEFNAKFGD